MLIDSHCHLEYDGLAEDQHGVLERARAAGVGGFLNISTRRSEWDRVVGTAQREKDVWASVGIHPHEADAHEDLGRDILLKATEADKVVGIGETGLDYYYDKSDRQVQQALFRMHIGVARETGLPLIIHTRDAEDDTAAILADEKAKGDFPALIHCFTASAEFGEKVLEMGLSISISGIVTFKNAKDLQAVAARGSSAIGCWWKRIARFSRPFRIAANPANRLSFATRPNSSPTCAEKRSRILRHTRHAISTHFSAGLPREVDHAGFGHVVWRSACRQ